MNIKNSILFLAFLLVTNGIFSKKTPPAITDYHRIFIPCCDKVGNLRIAIRMYYYGEKPYFLVVNPYNFVTEVGPIASFKYRLNPEGKNKTGPRYFTMREIENTPYMKELARYSSRPYKKENYGLTEANHSVNGQFLTIDMCPSAKVFERNFFNALNARADETHHAIPVALAITGLWMIDHQKEFDWLIQQEKANKLQITWINHSFSHVYYTDLPPTENFLLSPQTNFTHEILDVEKMLLEKHQLPSVFFRFPGLVSDEKLILELRNFSLIPIGSDAWLAKGQPIESGSIILVHGNSNEPEGIEKFMSIFKQKNIQLLPINQALGNSSGEETY
jgi:hypothetical protein